MQLPANNLGRQLDPPFRPQNTSAPPSRVIPNPKAKLLDQVREVLRVKHYSIRTEDAYVGWIKRFIFFYNKRQPGVGMRSPLDLA